MTARPSLTEQAESPRRDVQEEPSVVNERLVRDRCGARDEVVPRDRDEGRLIVDLDQVDGAANRR